MPWHWRSRPGRATCLALSLFAAAGLGACASGGDTTLPAAPAKLTVLTEPNAAPPVGLVTTTLPPTTTSLPGSQTYTVAVGDTLYGIATRYSTTMATLLSLNQFADPNNIAPGQRIVVPAPPTTTTTLAPTTSAKVGGPGNGTGTTAPSATTSPAATASTLPAATENG